MLQIKDFELYLTNGYHIQHPIEELNILKVLIELYDRNIISKIVFHYHSSSNNSLILYKYSENDLFRIEFLPSLSNKLNNIETSTEEKINQYNAVINALQKNQSLSIKFIPYIVIPFITYS
jgi:hypothetical protein